MSYFHIPWEVTISLENKKRIFTVLVESIRMRRIIDHESLSVFYGASSGDSLFTWRRCIWISKLDDIRCKVIKQKLSYTSNRK